MKNRLPSKHTPMRLPDIRVRVLTCQAIRLTGKVSWRTSNHCVPYWRLYWNPAAGATLMTEQAQIPLTPDKIYLVTPDTVTSNWRACALDHYFIHFIADAPFDHVTPGVIDYPAAPALTAAFMQLRGLPEAAPPRRQLRSANILFLCYYALSMLPEGYIQANRIDQRVQKAIACMHKNIAQPVDTATLALAAGMHPTAFIRLFKKCTGLTPHSFYRKHRVEEACRLLHSTEQKIDDIAMAAGFCDRYHFCRVFKKIRGITPAQFRRN